MHWMFLPNVWTVELLFCSGWPPSYKTEWMLLITSHNLIRPRNKKHQKGAAATENIYFLLRKVCTLSLTWKSVFQYLDLKNSNNEKQLWKIAAFLLRKGCTPYPPMKSVARILTLKDWAIESNHKEPRLSKDSLWSIYARLNDEQIRSSLQLVQDCLSLMSKPISLAI